MEKRTRICGPESPSAACTSMTERGGATALACSSIARMTRRDLAASASASTGRVGGGNSQRCARPASSGVSAVRASSTIWTREMGATATVSVPLSD